MLLTMLTAPLVAGELYLNFGFLGQVGVSKGKDYSDFDLTPKKDRPNKDRYVPKDAWLHTGFLAGGSLVVGYQFELSNQWFIGWDLFGIEVNDMRKALSARNEGNKLTDELSFFTTGLAIEPKKPEKHAPANEEADYQYAKKKYDDATIAYADLIGKDSGKGLRDKVTTMIKSAKDCVAFADVILPTQIKIGKHFGKFSVYGIINPLHVSFLRYMHMQEVDTSFGITLGVGAKYRVSQSWSVMAELKATHDYYTTKAVDRAAKALRRSSYRDDTIGFKGFGSKPTVFKFLLGVELGKQAV